MSKQDIKQAKYELRKLADLTNWEDNPRSALKEDIARLHEQIKRLGVHNGLLVNQDNIVLGGNMRLKAFRVLNKIYNLDEVMCRIVETNSPSEMLEYALSDNDAIGTTDDLKLAEQLTLHPIEMRIFKVAGNVLRPLDTIVNPPDHTTITGGAEPDKSENDETLEEYLNGSIKQIVLYYPNDEYANVVSWLEKIGQDLGLESHTDIVTKLIKDYYEGIVAEEKAN